MQNYYRLDQTSEVGNVISAKGGIRAVSGNHINGSSIGY
ncbi:hypothetical protein X781_10150 [Mannheimia sp. USDA-ARS-USMARC-1261]|nr:hypothetical protein X781_10150 [Mannheimia sp. USDA-ARS-USMARC-1261]